MILEPGDITEDAERKPRASGDDPIETLRLNKPFP